MPIIKLFEAQARIHIIVTLCIIYAKIVVHPVHIHVFKPVKTDIKQNILVKTIKDTG